MRKRIKTDVLQGLAQDLQDLFDDVTPTTNVEWANFAVQVNRRWPQLAVGGGPDRILHVMRRVGNLLDERQRETRHQVDRLRSRSRSTSRDRFAKTLGLINGDALTHRLGGHVVFTPAERRLIRERYQRVFPPSAPAPAPAVDPAAHDQLSLPEEPPALAGDLDTRRALVVFHRLAREAADDATALILDMAAIGNETALLFLERRAGIGGEG